MKKIVDKWVWHGFNNPARQDSLALHHWAKAKESEEPYPFARFNRKVEVIRYKDDDEYNQASLALENEQASGVALNTDWSREETDHLFDLCEQFSLRFIVIADRFGLDQYLVGEEVPERKREAKAQAKK